MGIRRCHFCHETNTFRRNHQLYRCLKWQPAILTPGQSKQMNVVWPSLFTGKAPYSLGCQVLASPSSHFICPIHSGHLRRLLLEQLLTWKPGFSVCFFLDQGGFRKSSIALSNIGFLRQRHPSFDSSETINFRKFIAQSVFITVILKFLKI